jgi:hypothetical protein
MSNKTTAKLEVRLVSDSIDLLAAIREELQELWPFSYPSEIQTLKNGRNTGYYRAYLNLSLPIPKKEAAV